MKDKKRVNILRQLIPLEMKKRRKHDGQLIFTFEKEIPNDLPSSTEVHLVSSNRSYEMKATRTLLILTFFNSGDVHLVSDIL